MIRSVSLNIQCTPSPAMVVPIDPAAAGLMLAEDGTVMLTEDGEPMRREIE